MATEPAATSRRDYGWIIGIWAVVVAFAIVTALRSYQVDIPMRDPGGRLFRNRLLGTAMFFAIFVLVDAAVRVGRRGWSIRKTVAVLRSRWPGSRLALALSGLLAYHIVYVCYRNLKSWDVFNTPLDHDLLRIDSWLFFGHSPAVLLHDLLGRDVSAHVLAAIYESFANLVSITFVAALVFANRLRDGFVFLVAAMWVWILGVASYYLVPSLGPFASAPHEFAQLAQTSIASTQDTYLLQRTNLLADPSRSTGFASISAFASLHVGYTFMVLLMLRYYGLRLLAHAVTVFLVATMLATIYFGWHFVTDDVAGLLLAYIAVQLAKLMVYPKGRPDATPGTSGTPAATGSIGAAGMN
ncbi:MAG: phosphatase PAP2 family protein [Nocardioidaceae bacterium]